MALEVLAEEENFFCFHLKNLGDISKEYFQLIQVNTNYLFDRSIDRYRAFELNVNFTAMRLQVKADDETCYIACDFKEYFEECFGKDKKFFGKDIEKLTYNTLFRFLGGANDAEFSKFLGFISEEDFNSIAPRDKKTRKLQVKKSCAFKCREFMLSINKDRFKLFLAKGSNHAFNEYINQIRSSLRNITSSNVCRDIIVKALQLFPSFIPDRLAALGGQYKDEYDRRSDIVNKCLFLFSMLTEDEQACIVKALLTVEEKKQILSYLYYESKVVFPDTATEILFNAFKAYVKKYMLSSLIKDIMKSLIYPLIERNRLAITFRLSIGFMLSAISECGTAIRFSVGAEYSTILLKYVDIISHVTYLLNSTQDPMLLFLAESRRSYFTEALKTYTAFHDSPVFSIKGNDFLHVTNDFVDYIDEDDDPVYKDESISSGQLVVFRSGPKGKYSYDIGYVEKSLECIPKNKEHINVFQWRNKDFNDLTASEQIHVVWAISFNLISIQKEFEGLQLYGYDNHNWVGEDTVTIIQESINYYITRARGDHSITVYEGEYQKKPSGPGLRFFNSKTVIWHDPTKHDRFQIPLERLKPTHKHALFSGLFFKERVINKAPIKFELKDDKLFISKISDLKP